MNGKIITATLMEQTSSGDMARGLILMPLNQEFSNEIDSYRKMIQENDQIEKIVISGKNRGIKLLCPHYDAIMDLLRNFRRLYPHCSENEQTKNMTEEDFECWDRFDMPFGVVVSQDTRKFGLLVSQHRLEAQHSEDYSIEIYSDRLIFTNDRFRSGDYSEPVQLKPLASKTKAANN